MAGGPIFPPSQVQRSLSSVTNPAVTKGNDFYFHVCFLDPFQGTVGAAYAFNELKGERSRSSVRCRTTSRSGLAKFFVDHFVKLSGDEKSIVATAKPTTPATKTFRQLTNIKQFERTSSSRRATTNRR